MRRTAIAMGSAVLAVLLALPLGALSSAMEDYVARSDAVPWRQVR